MTLKENIMKLQTYKMFEGEDTLYVERDDVLKLLKTGHWIIYDVHGHKACKCSECDKDVGYPCNDKYCPKCGCRMFEPQERSDAE